MENELLFPGRVVDAIASQRLHNNKKHYFVAHRLGLVEKVNN